MGRAEGGGGRGEEKAPVPRNTQPSWLAGDSGNCTGLLLAKGCAPKAHWSWGPPWILGEVNLARENGREKWQGCQGCLRMPSFLKPSVAWGFSVLTGRQLYWFQNRERTVHGGLEIPTIHHPLKSAGLGSASASSAMTHTSPGAAAIRLVRITADHPRRTVNVHRQDTGKDLGRLFPDHHTADL